MASIIVDGVSLTYGRPQKHVWTFVCRITENCHDIHSCPCNVNSKSKVTDFIENHYYCESTLHVSHTPGEELNLCR